MNVFEACLSMAKGNTVKSLVSNKFYNVIDGRLLADGVPVSDEYVTPVEADGKWCEVILEQCK